MLRRLPVEKLSPILRKVRTPGLGRPRWHRSSWSDGNISGPTTLTSMDLNLCRFDRKTAGSYAGLFRTQPRDDRHGMRCGRHAHRRKHCLVRAWRKRSSRGERTLAVHPAWKRANIPSRIRNILFDCWSILPSRHSLPRSMIRLPQCRPSIRSRIFCAVSAATTSMPALPEIQRACCVLSSPCRHGRIIGARLRRDSSIWRELRAGHASAQSRTHRHCQIAAGRHPCRCCAAIHPTSRPHHPGFGTRCRGSHRGTAGGPPRNSVFRGGQKINLADKCMLHCRAGAGSPARSRKPMLTHPNWRR